MFSAQNDIKTQSGACPTQRTRLLAGGGRVAYTAHLQACS